MLKIAPSKPGFLRRDSCISRLLSIIYEIQLAFGKNHTADVKGISLYICKAADKVWHDGVAFKVGLSTSKNMSFVCFNEGPLKMMKNALYFILKALFIFKIFTFFSGLFGHVEKRPD